MLFKKKHSVALDEKVWIELNFLKLRKLFGDEVSKYEIVTPDAPFFRAYTKGKSNVEALYSKACELLHLETEVNLRIQDEKSYEGPEESNGIYLFQEDSSCICIRSHLLPNAERLMAVMLHELAHEKLYRHPDVDRYAEDHELLTDLLPVYFGCGIFAANATIYENTIEEGTHAYFSFSQSGYLTSEQLGYAHALLAYQRQERKPSWKRHFRADAMQGFKSGLSYLLKTNDCLLNFNSQLAEGQSGILKQLAEGSSTQRLAGIWEIVATPDKYDDLKAAHQPLIQCLNDQNRQVIQAACDCLSRLNAIESVTALKKLFRHPDKRIRESATLALAIFNEDSKQVIYRARRMLQEGDTQTKITALECISALGPQAYDEIQYILPYLKTSITECSGNIDRCMWAIIQISENPEDDLRSYFEPIDRLLMKQVLSEYREIRALNDECEMAEAVATPG